MQSINEFEKVVNYIYGVYLDSITGFIKLRECFEKNQNDISSSLKISHQELASMDYLDSVPILYGKGNPNTSEAVELHRCTQKEYKERNSEGGLNFQFIGNMALVSLYQYWEDYHRSQVSKELGIEKKELKVPIMGDINRLRRSIIHHAGVALKDVEKCELIHWCKEGDSIYIDKEKFEELISHVKEMLNNLRASNT